MEQKTQLVISMGDHTPRLYPMTRHERAVFEDTVCRLILSRRLTRLQASNVCEAVATVWMWGDVTRVTGSTQKWVLDQLRSFPRLSRRRLETLPAFGCPDGRVEAFNMVVVADPNDKVSTRRMVHVAMNEEQADLFNELLEILVAQEGSRDSAWIFLVKTIATIVTGAQHILDSAHEVLVRIRDAFAHLDVATLPVATEADICRWSFGVEKEELTDGS